MVGDVNFILLFTFVLALQHIQASKGRIGVSCKACGYQGVLDSRHKVTTFIMNHPPNMTDDSSSKK